MMNSEADNLRDRSRTSIANMAPDAMNVDFPISTKKPSSKAGNSQQRQGSAVPVTPPSLSRLEGGADVISVGSFVLLYF